MNQEILKSILTIGESVTVEFKRCGNGIEHDVYESVCSFLNRFGGDIFMGILDDGTVIGVPRNAIIDMIKNFISVMSNPALFTPTLYLEPEVLEYEGKSVLHVHIPPSAEVHSYKKVIYDRVDDADIKVTATSQIAAMYIRKQNIFTEKRVYPYVTIEDLRLDLLPRIRQMAVNNAGGSHPWENMNDKELLQSAGLYSMDRVTGEKGYNLAAVMLLGKDNVIMDVVPAYETDALVRKINVDRYDDREIVRTNLVESYDKLLEFAKKHLPDKFYLEDTERKSLRNMIAREMLVNTLIHREFTSSYTAKFVIEKKKMYIENANRAIRNGVITPENLEPNPKNPVIASFFQNIGRSDRLGSGVRNLFKYSKYYSGQEPEFIEGDVFRIVVPLNEEYSYEMEKTDGLFGEVKAPISADKMPISADKMPISADKISEKKEDIVMIIEAEGYEKHLTEQERRIMIYVERYGNITSKQAEQILQVKQRRAREILKKLIQKNVLKKQGNYKNTSYSLNEEKVLLNDSKIGSLL